MALDQGLFAALGPVEQLGQAPPGRFGSQGFHALAGLLSRTNRTACTVRAVRNLAVLDHPNFVASIALSPLVGNCQRLCQHPAAHGRECQL
jgi:hypothetical protein